MKLKRLTEEEKRVIVDRGTEMPFSGEYDKHFKPGTYKCRRCYAPLFSSKNKFDAHCGWPSFDDEIEGATRRIPDGSRVEIRCSKCDAHLGHVFEGEWLTSKNERYCVNSISMVFEDEKRDKEKKSRKE